MKYTLNMTFQDLEHHEVLSTTAHGAIAQEI